MRHHTAKVLKTALKRGADKLVANGKDAPDSRLIYELLSRESSLKLFYVDESADHNSVGLPNLTPVPGTMILHQIICVKQYAIWTRDVSCFCSKGDGYKCTCVPLVEFNFPKGPVPTVVSEIDAGVSVEDNPTPTGTTGVQTASIAVVDSDHASHAIEGWLCPVVLSNKVIGQYCVVRYNEEPYPGIIRKIKRDSARVECMRSVGKNMVFQPEGKGYLLVHK